MLWLFIFLLVPVVIGSWVWYFSRSRSMLYDWASQNEFTLITAARRWMFRGPFSWSDKGQVVFRIAIRDRNGLLRNGWVRCGSFFLGLLSKRVDAHWDDNDPPSHEGTL